MPDPFIIHGKQILYRGTHFCDCADEAAAQLVIEAMNRPASIVAHLEEQARRRPQQRVFARGIRFAADEIRNGFDLPMEVAPAGERARYHDDPAPRPIECVPTVQEIS